tara:strand:- start:35 stop:1063 length:1029 start_codon:yes stop_codon:yes gene_type:complete
MMEDSIYIGVAFIIGGVLVWLLFKLKGGEGNILIQNQLKDIRDVLDRKLGESHESMRTQIGESNKLIRDITSKMTHLEGTNEKVLNIADQLKVLQNTLLNPKQRGVLGEVILESVLNNVLPSKHFEMQYKFNDGEIVDAAIFMGDVNSRKILPVDSKFPLENYNRFVKASDKVEKASLENEFAKDVKNRINETSKYVRPNEGTFDFAFMFIPSEAIYYDLLINDVGSGSSSRDLINYAFEKQVIIVASTSMMAYLQTIMHGLRALQIEESAKEIRSRVEELGRHIGSYDEYMKKLGKSLGTTVNHYNHAYKELNKIDKDVLRITDDSIGIEPKIVDKPHLDE